MLKRLAERELKTKYGPFREILYDSGGRESIALVMGEIHGVAHVLCRIHSSCISAHVFNSIECTCREEMELSQAAIQRNGSGIIIYLDQEGKGNGHLALMKSIEFKKAGASQADAYRMAGYKADARDYQPAADIINDLQVKSIVLLTDSASKAAALRRMEIAVTGTRSIRQSK